MAEFAKYYVDFLWNALQNIWNFIYSILYAFYKIVVLDTINYFKALGAVVGNFDVLGWICLILVSLVNIALVFFIVYRLVQLIRRYIVYRGTEVEKDKLVCVTGISPSNRLYPADDLFLYRAKELYADLDLVDELDVFGMSPFGDESIIEKINEKNLIRIFVYNKNENDETKVWESKLKCKYELLESDDMK